MAKQKTKTDKVTEALDKETAETETAETETPETKTVQASTSASGNQKTSKKRKKSSSKNKKTKSAKKKPAAQASKTSGAEKTKKTKPKKTESAGPKAKAQTQAQSYIQSHLNTMEKIMTNTPFQFDKLNETVTEAGRENVEALVKSGNVFAQGFQDLVSAYVSLAQDSAEKNTQAVKSLLGCKTLTEFTEAQNALARQNFDDFLSGFTQLSEIGIKVTTDAFEPLNEQISKATKTLTKKAA